MGIGLKIKAEKFWIHQRLENYHGSSLKTLVFRRQPVAQSTDSARTIKGNIIVVRSESLLK